jgi:hypothetical protein
MSDDAMNSDTVRCVRVYSGDDGRAHFEDLVISLDNDVFGWKGVPVTVTTADFRTIRPDYVGGWSKTPQPRFVIVLAGVMLVEVGDGSTRRLEAGDVLLNEDMSGEGHKAHNQGTLRRIMTISIADDFDLERFRGSKGMS